VQGRVEQMYLIGAVLVCEGFPKIHNDNISSVGGSQTT